jgi:hypothetical protein
VHIGTFNKKVKISKGINQLALVLRSKYIPTPTSKKGAKFAVKLYRGSGISDQKKSDSLAPVKNIRGMKVSHERSARIGMK